MAWFCGKRQLGKEKLTTKLKAAKEKDRCKISLETLVSETHSVLKTEKGSLMKTTLWQPHVVENTWPERFYQKGLVVSLLQLEPK